MKLLQEKLAALHFLGVGVVLQPLATFTSIQVGFSLDEDSANRARVGHVELSWTGFTTLNTDLSLLPILTKMGSSAYTLAGFGQFAMAIEFWELQSGETVKTGMVSNEDLNLLSNFIKRAFHKAFAFYKPLFIGFHAVEIQDHKEKGLFAVFTISVSTPCGKEEWEKLIELQTLSNYASELYIANVEGESLLTKHEDLKPPRTLN